MAGGAESTSSAKREKLRKKKKRDALERKKNDLFLRIEKAKEYLAQQLPIVCADLEDENHDELMEQLPLELWEKIVDEYVQQNDLLALAMTCRFFRDTTKDLGKKVETNLNPDSLLELRENRNVTSHSLGWFCWVCDTMEVKPGFVWYDCLPRTKGGISDGAVYEGDLVNYAIVQGSVEILRWLVEEKGYKLNQRVDELAGQGGSIEVLEYLVKKGYKFIGKACEWAARGGHLESLKYLRGLDPPCPWDELACCYAAGGGQLEALKWLRDQDPPCPWSRRDCRADASHNDHQHIVKWINQREDETDVEYSDDDIRYW
ncbi:putative ankyrin repeat protein [Chloropicon roscoffensis]|uniref:Ankyrin repeat protein n=1 Tax=Chloropicon roscoffensis TaxID=1461544 RepID=A0AAX4PIZ7_9CHLO